MMVFAKCLGILTLFFVSAAAFAADCGLRSSLADMQAFGCDIEKMAGDCRSYFYENPDLLEFASDCASPDDQRSTVVRWFEACKDSGLTAWTELWEQFQKSGRAIDACGEKLECKMEVANSAYFVCKNPDGSKQFPCTDQAQLEDIDIRNLLRKRDQVRQMADRDSKYKADLIRQGVQFPDESGPPISALVNSALTELGVKARCFNSAGRVRMGCYALATVIDPTIVIGGVTAGSLKGAKWISAVLKGSRASHLAASALRAVSREEALAALQTKWGKALTQEDLGAIEAAHKIGAGEAGQDGGAAGLDNYTWGQWRRKYQELKTRFSGRQIRDLMDAGVVGAKSDKKTDLVMQGFETSEQKLTTASEILKSQDKKTQKFREFSALENQIDQLKARQEEIFSQWDPSSAESTRKTQDELGSLQIRLDKATREAHLWEKRKASDWSVVREDPEALSPHRRYEVQTDRGGQVQVEFSEDVVRDIMWSNADVTRKKASEAIVEAIGRGFNRGKNGGSGLDVLSLSGEKMVKVQIIGRGFGAYRVYGIEKNGVIYFVHWEHESNHHAAYLQRALESTNRQFQIYQQQSK